MDSWNDSEATATWRISSSCEWTTTGQFSLQNVLSYVTCCIRSTTSTSGTHHSEDEYPLQKQEVHRSLHLHPQGGKKFFRRNLQGKYVSAPTGHDVHPQPEQGSIFRTDFAGRVRFGGIFRRSLRATSIKKVVDFFGQKKCTPRQNAGYAYDPGLVFQPLFRQSC